MANESCQQVIKHELELNSTLRSYTCLENSWLGCAGLRCHFYHVSCTIEDEAIITYNLSELEL